MSGSPHRFLSPEGWMPPRGYANGVEAEGRTVWVAGQIGWDAATGEVVSDALPAQVGRALENVAAVLREAGAGPEHVVRMTWFVTERDAYLRAPKEIGAAYRAVFGRHFPAMSVVFVSALVEAGAKVEIEATAVVPAG